MLQVNRTRANTVSNASVNDSLILTSITNSDCASTVSASFTGGSQVSCFTTQSGWLDGNNDLTSLAQATLTGAGPFGEDVASAFYAAPASGITLPIDSGLYVVSGEAVGLKVAYTLSAQTESFTIAGTALGLAKGSVLIAESGSYTLSGTELQVRSAYRNLLENGTFDLTGTDVTLIYTPVTPGESIILESGSFELIGTSTTLTASQKAQIETGAYSLSGSDINLASGSSISLDTGDYSLNGSDIALVTGYGIILQSGDYVLNGSSVTLKYSGDSAQTIGNVTAGFAENPVSVGYRPTEITVKFKES